MTAAPMKVAIYARVSTDDKDQSPETQLMFLRDYCKVYNHSIMATFIDEGRSGKDPNRPEFQRMLTEAMDKQHRRFDAIICLRLDRFMRSALYGLQVTQQLRGAGCGLMFVKDQIDTTGPFGQFFYTMMLAFAEMERAQHAERVSEGIQRHIREGGTWGKRHRKDVNTELAVMLLDTGKAQSLADAARQLGVPRNTLREHLELKGIEVSKYTSRKKRGVA